MKGSVTRLGLLLGSVLLLFAFIQGCVPLGNVHPVEVTEVIEAAPMATPTPEDGRGIFTLLPTATPQQPAAIPESRRLVLEWPTKIRQGDADIVRLTLEMDEEGNLTPTAEFEGHAVSGETVSIPNVYETHRVSAEAWLDLAGIEGAEERQGPREVHPGEAVTFTWSLRPQESGTFRGAAWMELTFEPRAEGEKMQMTLPPQTLEIRVVNLFGLDGRTARLLGAVGSLLGAVFSVDDVLAWLRERWQRRKSQKEEGE